MASAVPTSPMAAPNMKPARRPQRPMASEAGTVASAEPAMWVEIGRVAHSGEGASASPASPLTAISVTLLV